MHRLPKHAYIVLDDLMLLSEVGLTQIDHVVVSVYGIFVIETKNYSGRITGTPRADFWTQHLHGKYNSFRNPFRQNYAHICALQSILDLPEQDAFVSIAAFADSAELEIQTEEELVHFTTLRKRIRAYREVQFSWETARVMAGTILLSNLDSKAARKQHLDKLTQTLPIRTSHCAMDSARAAAVRLFCETVLIAHFMGVRTSRRAAIFYKTIYNINEILFVCIAKIVAFFQEMCYTDSKSSL